MSLLQELEIAGSQLDSETRAYLDLYLATHPNLFLDDVYYGEEEWEKFVEWCHQHTSQHDLAHGYSEVPLQEEHKRFVDENISRFGYLAIDDETYQQLDRNTRRTLLYAYADVTSEMDQKFHDPYYEIHSLTDYVLDKVKDDPKLVQEILDDAKQKAKEMEKNKKTVEEDAYTKQSEEDEFGYNSMKSSPKQEQSHEER